MAITDDELIFRGSLEILPLQARKQILVVLSVHLYFFFLSFFCAVPRLDCSPEP